MLLCLIGDWALIYASVSKGITVWPRWKPCLGREVKISQYEWASQYEWSACVNWMSYDVFSFAETFFSWSWDFCCLGFHIWSTLKALLKALLSSCLILFPFAVFIFTVFILQVLRSFWRPISTHFGTCMQIHAQGVFSMVLTTPDPEISQCRHQIAMHNLNAKLSTSYFIVSTVYYSQANTILAIQLWQRVEIKNVDGVSIARILQLSPKQILETFKIQSSISTNSNSQ